jgi:hypothetical protein
MMRQELEGNGLAVSIFDFDAHRNDVVIEG